ncbi:MAG TPA: ABC transporter ATP-binding protein [Hyphomonadaceae bacterium]|nr:ABC transporter ATP-binding protein [Hyphomonadaceae bacterium]
MTNLALQVSDLTKIFRVWNKPSDMLAETLTGRKRHTDFTALDGVSFDLAQGTVLGILGRNGAGKSTLLRLVTGTLEPTRGNVKVNGRISSILELGTGFHSDYSGRENIFLGGMCLGLSRNEIKQRFDEIVDFSEIGEFIDRPFRTYSSGMQARLTFAVATSVNPDILIIDEALAVGDARFALKSFDRIRKFRSEGKAILLVSHDINTVSAFCDQAILLERGKLIASGQAVKVVNIYHELLFGTGKPVVSSSRSGNEDSASADVAVRLESPERKPASSASVRTPLGVNEPAETTDATELHSAPPDLRIVNPESGIPASAVDGDQPGAEEEAPRSDQYLRYGDRQIEIAQFQILDADGQRVTRIQSLGAYRFHLRLRANGPSSKVGVGVLIRTTKGAQVTAANSLEPVPTLMHDFRRKGEEVDILVPFKVNMGHGTYYASAICARLDKHKHDAQFDVLEFSVEQTNCHDQSLANLDMVFEFAPEALEGRIRASRAGIR